MARLLAAAASLHLLEQRGPDRYGLGSLGAAMLGNPAVAAMVEHHGMLYADLTDPLALLRGEAGPTELSRYWAYAKEGSPASLPAERVAAYSALMAASQPLVAAEILDAYPLRRHHCLLDLGGGEGAFLEAVAARAPGLRLMLFDLPAVAERARQRLGDRVAAVGGDFLQDPLPQGADIVTLVRVIHDHDEARALAILKAARRPCRRAARFSWPSPWPAPPAPCRSGRPISASTSWPWAVAGRAPRTSSRRSWAVPASSAAAFCAPATRC
jgi:demethylspheroidene O-methyltransferase